MSEDSNSAREQQCTGCGRMLGDGEPACSGHGYRFYPYRFYPFHFEKMLRREKLPTPPHYAGPKTYNMVA